MKKILYIRAFGMGDIIMSIPKWKQIHDQWDELYVLYYDFKYFAGTFHYDTELLQNIIKTSGLIKRVIYIPYNKIKLLCFIIKNFRKFDEVQVPIKTKRWIFRGKLLGKKCKYIFKSPYDTSKYSDVIYWETQKKELLYNYKSFFDKVSRDSNPWLQEKNTPYITIFVSYYERSINAKERKKIIEFILQQGYNIVLLWSKREHRIIEDLQETITVEPKIKNYINKTSFGEVLSLLENSEINISCNWGIMWLAHLLNKKNISINTVSAHILQPPTDWINCISIRPTYTCKKPCEALFYRYQWKKWIECCDFYNTVNEGICRKISGEQIIKFIKTLI